MPAKHGNVPHGALSRGTAHAYTGSPYIRMCTSSRARTREQHTASRGVRSSAYPDGLWPLVYSPPLFSLCSRDRGIRGERWSLAAPAPPVLGRGLELTIGSKSLEIHTRGSNDSLSGPRAPTKSKFYLQTSSYMRRAEGGGAALFSRGPATAAGFFILRRVL